MTAGDLHRKLRFLTYCERGRVDAKRNNTQPRLWRGWRGPEQTMIFQRQVREPCTWKTKYMSEEQERDKVRKNWTSVCYPIPNIFYQRYGDLLHYIPTFSLFPLQSQQKDQLFLSLFPLKSSWQLSSLLFCPQQLLICLVNFGMPRIYCFELSAKYSNPSILYKHT